MEISPQLQGTHRFPCQLASRCWLVSGEPTRPCRFSVFRVMLVLSTETGGPRLILTSVSSRQGVKKPLRWSRTGLRSTSDVCCLLSKKRAGLDAVRAAAGLLTGVVSWSFCGSLSRFGLLILAPHRSDAPSLEPWHAGYVSYACIHVSTNNMSAFAGSVTNKEEIEVVLRWKGQNWVEIQKYISDEFQSGAWQFWLQMSSQVQWSLWKKPGSDEWKPRWWKQSKTCQRLVVHARSANEEAGWDPGFTWHGPRVGDGAGFTVNPHYIWRVLLPNCAVSAFSSLTIQKKGDLLILCSLGTDSSAKYHPKVFSVHLKSSLASSGHVRDKTMGECRDVKNTNPPSFALILDGFCRIFYFNGPSVFYEMKGVRFN